MFCDIAINEDDAHFSVYEAIKDELVRRGIPREEICFAGDAKTDRARADMFEQLRKVKNGLFSQVRQNSVQAQIFRTESVRFIIWISRGSLPI